MRPRATCIYDETPSFFPSSCSLPFLRLLSDSPAILLMISGPLMRKKKAPVSLATARAISVFPVPGGPYRRMPRGGFTPIALKSCGWRRGSSTICRRRRDGKRGRGEKEDGEGRKGEEKGRAGRREFLDGGEGPCWYCGIAVCVHVHVYECSGCFVVKITS